MGYLSNALFQRKDDGSLKLFREIFGGRLSKTGEAVNLKTAIRCATAFACARVIAQDLARVPLKLFRELPNGGKTLARDHALFRVLNRKPNPWQTSFELRETVGLHLALAGRAYCFKTIVGGVVRELIPFEPGSVVPKLAADGIELTYQVTGRDGRVREFAAGLIWHLKGPSWNGWEGLDPLEIAREAVGLAIATEASHSELHKNGIRPSGVYSVEGKLDPQQYADLRKFLAENYAGDKQGLPMIVDRGATWLSTVMNGVDAQHLETRRYQVEEVCRGMGVMPLMVYAGDKTQAFASVEALFQAHVTFTMSAWWTRVEQSIDCNVLTEKDSQDGIYAKFIGSALLRGATKDRGEYYSRALGSGGAPAWMTQDEVRALEELNPMGGAAAALPIATNVPARAPAGAADQDPNDPDAAGA